MTKTTAAITAGLIVASLSLPAFAQDSTAPTDAVAAQTTTTSPAVAEVEDDDDMDLGWIGLLGLAGLLGLRRKREEHVRTNSAPR